MKIERLELTTDEFILLILLLAAVLGVRLQDPLPRPAPEPAPATAPAPYIPSQPSISLERAPPD